MFSSSYNNDSSPGEIDINSSINKDLVEEDELLGELMEAQ
jgi:hypothetical protein